MGRTGDAAHQDPLRAPHRRPARRPRRRGRGVLGPHPARHDPAGLPASLRPHRGHAGPSPAAGVRGDHDARGVRQHGPQRHRLPVCGRLQRRAVRRHPLRARADVLPARPRRHAGLRAQVQGRVLGLQGERVRAHQLPRPGRDGAHARGRRRRRARLRARRRRRAGRGPASGAGLRRFPPRRGAPSHRAGDEPRLLAPRRATEPRASPVQVRGQEAGHRGDQAGRARRARQAPARPAVDRLPGGPSRHRREAHSPAGRAAVRCPRGLRAVARDERHPSTPGRLRHGAHHAPAGRPDVRAGACARGHRAQVHRRHDAHDGGPEHAPALGQRGRPARGLLRARASTPRADGGGHHRRHHGVPRHRHVQAGDLVVARAGRAAHEGPSRRGPRPRPQREAPAHQDERLLQLLRPASRRRSRASSA